MNDKIFGELEYEFGWIGKAEIVWNGDIIETDLFISGEEDEEIEEYQYDSFSEFMNKWPIIENDVKTCIYNYYIQIRKELGYEDNSSPDYPNIDSIEDLNDMISLDSVNISSSGVYEERCVYLALSCSWDDENGVGIRILNETVDEVGYQDIAF